MGFGWKPQIVGTNVASDTPTGKKTHHTQKNMLGAGLFGMFYTMTRHGRRNRAEVVYSRSADRVQAFAEEWNIPHHLMEYSACFDLVHYARSFTKALSLICKAYPLVDAI